MSGWGALGYANEKQRRTAYRLSRREEASGVQWKIDDPLSGIADVTITRGGRKVRTYRVGRDGKVLP